MGALALFLQGALSGILAWFAEVVSRRVVIVLTVIAAVIGFTTAFWAAMDALVESVLPAMPGYSYIATVASWAIPCNLDECLAALIAAHIARKIYDWQVRLAILKTAGS